MNAYIKLIIIHIHESRIHAYIILLKDRREYCLIGHDIRKGNKRTVGFTEDSGESAFVPSGHYSLCFAFLSKRSYKS